MSLDKISHILLVAVFVGCLITNKVMAQREYKKFNEDMNKQVEKFRKQQEEMNRQRDYDLIPRIPPPTRPPLGDRDATL